MCIKNSVYPSTEPWGTPETTLPQFESVPDTYVNLSIGAIVKEDIFEKLRESCLHHSLLL